MAASCVTPRGEVEGSGLVGGLQTHTRGEVEGSGIGVGFSRPIPRGGLQTHTQGEGVGIPACTEADPLASRRLLLWAVCILLECILVQGGHGTGKTGNLVLTFFQTGKTQGILF